MADDNPSLPDPSVIHIPSYSRWFSWSKIHECEARHLPEFFDGKSPSRNPRAYKYLRNSIVRAARLDPARRLTLTRLRRTIVGDVGSVRRVFEFLEAWGLINYAARPQLKYYEDRPSPAPAPAPPPRNKACGRCSAVCTISCFSSQKHDITLCARCYVIGNHRPGVTSADFKRVELTEELTAHWADKEILQLLEAVMHYGDDWKKVANHVTGKTDKECIARFIKLPFGDQFAAPPPQFNNQPRLSPLADASNPIMAQAAFLSAVAGVEVAEVAARAALVALSDLNSGKIKETLQKPPSGPKPQESDITSNDNNITELEAAIAEARLQLQKEEEELEGAISAIVVQTKEIEDHIVHFEDFELETERRRRQLQQFQSLFSADKLKLVLQKTATTKVNGSLEENVITE